jgi:hypothetical protein
MRLSKQTRHASLTETIVNTTVGFGINFAAQVALFHLFDISAPLSTNFVIAVIFTVLSVIRGFIMRRIFETLRVRGILP